MSHERWNPPRVAIRSSKRSSRAIVGRLSHAGRLARVAAGVRYRCRPGPRATVGRVPGFWGAMDTDSSHIDPLIDGLATDLDGTFEALVLAHQDRIYAIALRVLGDPRDAEEAAQDAFVRAYRALGGYDQARIRDLRLRPWLATIVLNLCRSRLTRRPANARRSVSLDGPLPGILEPRADETHGPVATSAARAAAADWADLLLTLPPAYRSA